MVVSVKVEDSWKETSAMLGTVEMTLRWPTSPDRGAFESDLPIAVLVASQ